MKIEIPSKEYDLVLWIRKTVFVEEQGIPLELEIDETEKEAIYFLTVHRDRPVSTGRLRIAGKKIKFERIATLKEARRTGAGKALMTFLLAYAREHYKELTPYLHAQESSKSFYENLGWKVTGAPFTEAGIPHIAMTI